MLRFRFVLAVFIGLCTCTAAIGQQVGYQITEQEPRYVGEVFIVGNTQTPDRYIRALCVFTPGQVLRYPEVRLTERHLHKTNWFLVDEKNGIRPTVEILESKGPYKDILIKVHERPGNWARLAAWDIVLARSTLDYSHVLDAVESVQIGVRQWREKK